MKLSCSILSLVTLLCATLADAAWPAPIHHGLHAKRQSPLLKRDVDPSLLYPERNFSLPVDHFQNSSVYEPHSNDSFDNRYVSGGPASHLVGYRLY